MEQAYNVFLLLGGIALFLFGISYMGAGLEQAAGDNLRVWLQKLTKTPISAVLVGAGATAVIQSSGATMVMTMGFVNAQIMTLTQALYVMLGASIGTTVTAQLIAFDIDPWAPLILFIGLIFTQFIKNRTAKKIGAIILGFGMLFMGIYTMGEAVTKMNLGVIMKAFLDRFQNPLILLLFGLIFTFIIQSSSASVGILQVLVASGLGTSVGLEHLVYLIMGMNVGAVAPLVLSSLGGNKGSKRAALAETLAKVLGVVVFSVVLLIFPGCLDLIRSLSPADASRQIANTHLIFNVVACLLLAPTVKLLSKIVMKIMPDEEENELWTRKLLYCTSGLSKKPSVMIAQSKREILRFAEMAKFNLHEAMGSFFLRDIEKAEEVVEREKTINFINHEINAYLTELYAYQLPDHDVARIGTMFKVCADLERIGDLAENISEYSMQLMENKANISDEGLEDLREMALKVEHMVDLSIRAYEEDNKVLLGEARAIEDSVDAMEIQKIDNHIDRLKRDICEPRGGVIYTDMVSDLERVSDLAMNIAEAVLGINASIEELEVNV